MATAAVLHAQAYWLRVCGFDDLATEATRQCDAWRARAMMLDRDGAE